MRPEDFMKKGYVLIPRSLMERAEEKGGPQNEEEALITILTQVNYKDRMCDILGQATLCRRGESLHSIQNWEKLFHWKRGKTKYFLNKLQEMGVIELLPHPKTTHLRVVDYDSWTGGTGIRPLQLKAEQDEEFDQFWNSYHEITETRKLNVGKARREWNLLNREVESRPM